MIKDLQLVTPTSTLARISYHYSMIIVHLDGVGARLERFADGLDIILEEEQLLY